MKVIIVGAGISGLTLAAALAQLAPRIEVVFVRARRSGRCPSKGLCNRSQR
jgi:protoporphyrinogen oxidase